MNDTVTYRGYTARIEYSSEDKALVGHLIGIGDIVGFHAEDVAGIEAAFHEAVDNYVALNAEKAQKPYSGNLMFRVGPSLHAAAARAAKAASMSLTQWGTMIIAAAAGADATGAVAKDQDTPEEDRPIKERASWDDREIVKLASGTILILRDGAVQPVVVKDVLRSIAAEIGVDELNTKRKLKNTRSLGADVVRTLTSQRDYMRKLAAELGLEDRERICRVYEKAEAEGLLLVRRSNAHKISAYEYARRLLDDGERKGWLNQA